MWQLKDKIIAKDNQIKSLSKENENLKKKTSKKQTLRSGKMSMSTHNADIADAIDHPIEDDVDADNEPEITTIEQPQLDLIQPQPDSGA